MSTMTAPNLLNTAQFNVLTDNDLFRSLLGRRLCMKLRTLAVIGAHRFDEKPVIDWILPKLRKIYVFEPLAKPLESLNALARSDPRISIFGCAVADRDGECDFFEASNDGQSSSILQFGTHEALFPEVKIKTVRRVSTRRLDSALSESGLPWPDCLIVDVQGAEYQVLSAIPRALLSEVRLIYVEVSTEEVYRGGHTLNDLERLLSPEFTNIGFAPLTVETPTHGNAVFVRRQDVPQALSYTLKGHLRPWVDLLRERLGRSSMR